MQIMMSILHVATNILPTANSVLVPVASVVLVRMVVVNAVVIMTPHGMAAGEMVAMVVLHGWRWGWWAIVVDAAAGDSHRLEQQQQNFPSGRAHDNSSPGGHH
jgi:hypothetical protein